MHKWLEDDGFSEIYVDHLDDQCVSVTRRNPDTLEEISVFAYLVRLDLADVFIFMMSVLESLYTDTGLS